MDCSPPGSSVHGILVKSEEELKSLLIRVKEESEKAGLKLIIKKTKIMATSGGPWGFPDGSAGKESSCNPVYWPGSIPGSGRSTGEGIGYPPQYSWASLVDQLVKNPPAMRETWVRSLGWEKTLRRKRVSTPVFWPGEFHGLYMGSQRVRHDWVTFTFTFMASGPITSLQIEGENGKAVTYFIFLGSKITANSDCCHEIKRFLLLERKAMTNLDSILKTRDIILLTKVHTVKDMFFSVVLYECESSARKKAESWRIDIFEWWC